MKEFDPTIVLKGKRITLRFLKESDTKDIFNNINHNQKVLRYFIDSYYDSIDQLDLKKRIDYFMVNERYIFAIEKNDTKEVIGMILWCNSPSKLFQNVEIGYAIGEEHWNKGYTSEALILMIDFCFSAGIHRVVTACVTENIASRKVMEKCGMIYESLRKEELYYHEQYYDTYNYYLINPKDLTK